MTKLDLSDSELRSVWKALEQFADEFEGLYEIDVEDEALLSDAHAIMDRIREAYLAVQIAPEPPESGY